MPDSGVLETEDRFFEALRRGDHDAVAQVLSDDFVIVDIRAGAAVPREGFLGAISGGDLSFEKIEPSERSVRRYGEVAVVVGRTAMLGSFSGEAFEAASRYTHVLTRIENEWQLVSAQGTQIIE